MQAEIISVGTELLLGHIVNTNAVYISKKLAQLGINLYRQTTVGDNLERLISTIKEALSRSDMVFTIGGLGPTVDDITLQAVCKASGKKLIHCKALERSIGRHFQKRDIKKTPEEAARQAYVPNNSIWYENKVGTAPAVLINREKKLIIALPGPPRELIPLFEKNIVSYLKKKGMAGRWLIKTKTLKIVGLAEAQINNIVKDLLGLGPDTTLGIYVHLCEVSLKITSRAKSERAAMLEIKKVENVIRFRLGNHVYGSDSDTLETVVGKFFAKNKKTLAIAESCTGGLIANRITNVSGSSVYFKLGIVAYSNEAKVKLLNVSKKSIQKYGAVSKEIAIHMAEGIKKVSKSDIALGVTGIAGPRGESKKKPIGLVCIAVVSKKIKIVKEYRFHGNREEIKLQSSIMALNMIRSLFSIPKFI